MDDKQIRETTDASNVEVTELNDEILEGVAGGFVYHDRGDAAAHRQEAYYVLDDGGDIIMKLDDVSKAKHWAGNLRTNQRLITAEEFDKLRKKHHL